MERLQVLTWMEDRVKEFLYTNMERKLFNNLENAYELAAIAKTFVDTKFVFLSLKLLGCLLMHMNYLQYSVEVFTLMRDLGYKTLNWSFLL